MTDDTTTTPAAAPPVDVNLRVDQFVKLRDLKAAIAERQKEELAPINDALDKLGDMLLNEMKRTNTTSLKTTAGTASVGVRESASAADPDALWTHIVTSGEWELLDKKPNVTAVKDYIAKHGSQPPGVNFSSQLKVNVRRA